MNSVQLDIEKKQEIEKEQEKGEESSFHLA